eukprot:scaffold54198_cov73-Phaeocystis_antarctica.AAC.7
MRINPGHSRRRTPSALHGRPRKTPDSVRAATRRWLVPRAQRATDTSHLLEVAYSFGLYTCALCGLGACVSSPSLKTMYRRLKIPGSTG